LNSSNNIKMQSKRTDETKSSSSKNQKSGIQEKKDHFFFRKQSWGKE
jgi:hypothetical protein